VRGLSGKRQKSQQVSGVASAVPFLGETLPEEGKWEKEAARLVPVPGAGAKGSSKKPPAGALSYSEEAEYKYPGQNCTNVHFC